MLKAAAQATVRQTRAIEAILLYGSRANRTHRKDSDYDLAIVTELGHEEALEAAQPLYEQKLTAKYRTELVCRASGEIERRANTAGTLEARIAREAILVAGRWTRPKCTQGTELEIDPEQVLTWAQAAAVNAMGATSWLETASQESWECDNQAGARVQRMAEQVMKGILSTFGVYESDIHDLDRSADELENAYADSQWMKADRTRLAAMVRALGAKGRAALRAEEREEPFEPLNDTIERLGAAYELLLCWVEVVARVHPDIEDELKDIATRDVRLDVPRIEERGGETESFRKLTEHLRRALNQAKELAGE